MTDRIAQIQERLETREDGWYEYPQWHAPEDITYLLARLAEVTNQRDQARGKLAEAWSEGHRVGNLGYLESTNPYLLPGEDGAR